MLLAPVRAVTMPFRYAWRAARSVARVRPLAALGYLARAAWAVVMVPVVVWLTLFRVVWRLLMQGWLTVLLGVLLAYLGAAQMDRAAPFSAGVTLVIIGLALMLRIILERGGMRPELRDRIAFTFAGVGVLAFWLLPADLVESVVGELVGDFDILFVSGICMVTAAVWTVMYNADLLLKAVTWLTSPIGKLRPVLVTAIAYPMSAKLRTGLTLAMFALVFFTLMFISVLTETFSTQFTDPEGGHWRLAHRGDNRRQDSRGGREPQHRGAGPAARRLPGRGRLHPLQRPSSRSRQRIPRLGFAERSRCRRQPSWRPPSTTFT